MALPFCLFQDAVLCSRGHRSPFPDAAKLQRGQAIPLFCVI